MSGWELRQDTIEDLVARLDELEPRVIVELGSGRSTLYIARWANEHGARFVSLEHKEVFAEETRGICRDVSVDLRCVPLVDGFYQTDLPHEIDFALIDGPPGLYGVGRMNTFPSLEPYLAPEFEVWLDDASRGHEQECVKAWSDTYPLDVQVRGSVMRLTPRITTS